MASTVMRIILPSISTSASAGRRLFSTSYTRLREELPPTSENAAANSSFADAEDNDLDLSQYSTLGRAFGSNEMKDRLRSLLREFHAPVQYAMAYGSGVFSQGKGTSSKPQIDLIFGVSHTAHWHSLNLRQHRDHYSFLGSFGSDTVSYVQDKMGAGVYFNPYVDIHGTMVKYGVVNLDTLCSDLSSWDTLYLAGRLHKPVMILREPQIVNVANRSNLLSAVRVALLLLPEQFTERQLYMTIAGLSYMGDPRMSFAENPHKVTNIVDNNIANFRRLYSPLIQQLPNIAYVSPNGPEEDPMVAKLIQDMDPVRRGNIVCRLPKKFRNLLYFQYQKKYQIPNLEFRKMVNLSDEDEVRSKKKGGEFEQRIGADVETIGKEVSNVIKSTVGWPSTTQSIKGLLTAGPVKSFSYMTEKITKALKAKKGT